MILDELVNHEVRSLPFIISPQGISTPNYPPFNGELRHSYNNISSLDRFFSYGFFARESIIFSFPFSIKNDNQGINLCCKGKTLKDDEIKIERVENNIILEGLPIADVNNLKLPINYFKEVLIRIGNNNFSVELFSRILKLNIEMRKLIIHESQKIDNEVSNNLTNLIKYEISLLLADN